MVSKNVHKLNWFSKINTASWFEFQSDVACGDEASRSMIEWAGLSGHGNATEEIKAVAKVVALDQRWRRSQQAIRKLYFIEKGGQTMGLIWPPFGRKRKKEDIREEESVQTEVSETEGTQ